MDQTLIHELDTLLAKWKAAIDASPDETLPLTRVRQSALRSCYNDLTVIVSNYKADDHA